MVCGTGAGDEKGREGIGIDLGPSTSLSFWFEKDARTAVAAFVVLDGNEEERGEGGFVLGLTRWGGRA